MADLHSGEDRPPKKISAISLAWGGALLVGLLFVLAFAVLISSGELERQAQLIESDSVPGLIDAHAMRSAYSKGFTALIQATGAGPRARRDDLLRAMSELDAAARVAADDYRRTIHIDPRQDTANYERLLQARDEFLRVRSAYLAGFPKWPAEQAQDFFVRRVTPTYDALMQACDVLVDYNNHTGTVISHALLSGVAKLRWTVAWVVFLAVVAAANFGMALIRKRRVELALRESQQKFAAAFQLSPLSMVISRRADGRMIEANDAFRQKYNLGKRSLAGKSAVDIGVWPSEKARDDYLRTISADQWH